MFKDVYLIFFLLSKTTVRQKMFNLFHLVFSDQGIPFSWFENIACLFEFRKFDIKGVQKFLQKKGTVKLENVPIFDISKAAIRRIVSTDDSCKM